MSNPKTDWQAVRKSLQKYLEMEPEFLARFKAAAGRYAQLQKTVLPAVRRWEIYTFTCHEMDPMYFVLDWALKPGRLLKSEPDSEKEVERYGFDADGRIIVAQRFPAAEGFREFRPGRIDSTLFDPNRIHLAEYLVINVETLFLDENRPTAFFKFGSNGMLVRSFEYEGSNIVRVLEAHRSRKAWGPQEWSFKDYRINHENPALLRISSEDEAGKTNARQYKMPKLPGTKSPVPELDLRKDLQELEALLGKAAGQFAKKLKPSQLVSRIGIAFMYYNNPEPEVYLNFDTRPGHEPDGTWTHEFFKTIKRPKWGDFLNDCESLGKGVLIDTGGNKHSIGDASDDRLVGWFGQMLVEVLKQSRAKNLFKLLPKTPECEMSVEDNGDGAFGWPRYEDRGKENLV